MSIDVSVAKEHPFLKSMAPEHRSILLQGAEQRSFHAGEILFQEGQPANRVYLLLDGQVALQTHVHGQGDVVVASIDKGQVLGWSWLVPPFVWHFQARALQPSSALVLNGGHLLVASEQDHYLGHELMKNLSKVILDVLLRAHERWIQSGNLPPPQPAAPPVGGKIMVDRGLPLEVRLANHPFFHGMQPAYLRSLALYATQKEFEPGQMLFRAGETAEGIHIIEQGLLMLESPRPTGASPVQTVGAGDAVGWSAFCEPYEWHFDARAIEDTSTVFLRAADLRERCAGDYHFGYDFTKRVTRMMLQRLQSTRNRMWQTSR